MRVWLLRARLCEALSGDMLEASPPLSSPPKGIQALEKPSDIASAECVVNRLLLENNTRIMKPPITAMCSYLARSATCQVLGGYSINKLSL